MPTQDRTTQFGSIYRELEHGFHAITHNDDAWFDETDRTGESRRVFAAQLDGDARRLSMIARRLRSVRPGQ